ncbi:MAG: YidC/Oxa1 family membrane protein insertase [Lachnospiraceae bacterium]|nr:YidC/Oxa1 family membrane protein insertase [Lachnospiraceae bacterium]MDD6856968.1 YidC/Oxa1 family membrane protein insertase [Lachnospiraceae bacterium]
MFDFLLTQNSTPIIGWCASILGKVMQALYALFCMIGVENIGLCIIIFTLLIKLVLFPMALKQQKFSKLSTLMNPELQAIQKKYQGKRDNASMMKMQEETQAVYEKYGTSPTGSCLQMLIQMPILFSLYYIISNIPAYVPQVQEYYTPVSEVICDDYEYFGYFDKIVTEDKELKYDYVSNVVKDFEKTDGKNKKVIDVLARYSNKQWSDLEKSYNNMEKLVDELKSYSDSDWEKIAKKYKGDEKEKFNDFVEVIKDDEQSAELLKSYSDSIESIDSAKNKIMKIYAFGPINLTQSPMSTMGWAILIPLLSFLTQWYSTRLSFKNSEMPQDNPMASSMKMMTTIMPLFSLFIALSVPAGLGLYWAISGLFQIIQQLALNNYFKKVDVNDIIAKNVEKANKKKAKQGYVAKQVINAANTNTKSISNNVKVNGNKESVNKKGKIKSGSMAEKANMVKAFDERNK